MSSPAPSNPAADVGDPATGAWLLGHGYALAGSSYATTGWAIATALPDQISHAERVRRQLWQAAATRSPGGIRSAASSPAGLIQDYPQRFSAALPMCGVLSGGVATWNTALDAEFAFQQLIDPAVQVVNITSPGANLAGGGSGRRAPRSRPRRAGPGSRWCPRSATHQAGSPR